LLYITWRDHGKENTKTRQLIHTPRVDILNRIILGANFAETIVSPPKQRSVDKSVRQAFKSALQRYTTVKTSMSSTFTIRIPRELKEKMKKNPAEWSQEVRNFIEERIKQIELIQTLEEIESKAENRKMKADSTTLIREDRERQT
jgi:hypothetical protein